MISRSVHERVDVNRKSLTKQIKLKRNSHTLSTGSVRAQHITVCSAWFYQAPKHELTWLCSQHLVVLSATKHLAPCSPKRYCFGIIALWRGSTALFNTLKT